ncbi:MAG: hypothetical protein ABIJ04_03170 [Bacteroidota bacterium]
MKGNLFETNKSLCYFALLIIVFITFYPFFLSGFGCADDIQNYLVLKSGGTWPNMIWLAKFAGRFYYLIVHPVYMVPYLADSMFVTKLFHHIPLIIGIVLFAVILFRMNRSRELSLFYLLIFLTVAQASKHTSLFLNYPFFFTFSFDLLLISFLLLLSYFDTSRKYHLVLSVILFAVVLLFSEIYLVYLLIFAITIVIYVAQNESSAVALLKRAGLIILPFLGVAALYLAAYFLYRVYYPSHYIGTMIDTKNVDFPGFFNALWNLSYASYPLTMFEENRHLLNMKSELIGGHSPVVLNILLNARIEWIIKGICVALTGFILLTGIHRISYKTLLAGSGLAVLLIFLPQIPLAITVKYISHVEGGMKGYIPAFFSMFGTVLLLSLLLGYLVSLLHFNRFVKISVIFLFASGLFVLSVLTDLNNYTVAKDTRRANIRFYAMDELMKTPSFQSIPSQATLYTQELYRHTSQQYGGLTEQGFNWGKYITARTGITYQVFRYFKDIPVPLPGQEKPIYSMAAQQAAKSDELLLVLARLPQKTTEEDQPAQFADQVWLLYYSAYKIFSIGFNTRDEFIDVDTPLYVNNRSLMVRPGRNIELTINNPQLTQPATFFTIQTPGIDLKSIRISDIVDMECPVFTIRPDQLK